MSNTGYGNVLNPVNGMVTTTDYNNYFSIETKKKRIVIHTWILSTVGNDVGEGLIRGDSQSVRERRDLVRVDSVRDGSTILQDPLVVVMNGVVVDQDLVAITVVVDSDSRVESIDESPLKCHSLLLTPSTAGSLAVQGDGVLLATDADVEKVVAGVIEDIDGGINDT